MGNNNNRPTIEGEGTIECFDPRKVRENGTLGGMGFIHQNDAECDEPERCGDVEHKVHFTIFEAYHGRFSAKPGMRVRFKADIAVCRNRAPEAFYVRLVEERRDDEDDRRRRAVERREEDGPRSRREYPEKSIPGHVRYGR